MKRILLSFVLAASLTGLQAQRLIVRGDDIGCAHSANIAVIEAYTDGIERSAEVMVVGPWFPEAARMLNAAEGLDVGVHVVLTSEWDNYKWRPITHCPTLCDEYGYFLRGTFPSKAYPDGSMMERKDRLSLAEIEAEIRAQVDIAVKTIKNVTHISSHMAWCIVSPEINAIGEKIAAEYGLCFVDSAEQMTGKGGLPLARFDFGMGVPVAERETRFIEALSKMEKGKTYVTIDHPAVRSLETEGMGHVGYENVAEDRQGVLDLFTSPRVKRYMADHGIELVSYGQVIAEQQKAR